jgi:hypothetical protein
MLGKPYEDFLPSSRRHAASGTCRAGLRAVPEGESSATPLPGTPPRPALTGPRRITIKDDGSLANGITGFAWVAGGQGTTFSWPVGRHGEPDNSGGLIPKDGKVCASGSMAGLRCVNENLPKMRCNWQQNWGVQIGFNVQPDHTPWGEQAPNAIAVEFQGRANSYRLNAHRNGDPERKLYCIADYKSGQIAKPSMFKTECWADKGEMLSDFKSVDTST